ncbi:MAG: UDP-N-acetylmuramate dehydrogenase [Nitrospirae bacterium]|nr:UDP-N-acetylmuramate dehydrogenase [Nitrospirota bacterium]
MTSQAELTRFFGRISHRFNEPLAKHTYLKIGGSADLLLFPEAGDIQPLIKKLKSISMPYVVLGGGSNVVVDDAGLSGAVIFMNKISYCEEAGNKSEFLKCGSGISLAGLLNVCAERGLTGMEGLAGIPGTLGGALRGNSGSFGSEIKDVVESIDIIDNAGDIITLGNSKIGFRYRESGISGDSVILCALIRLKQDDASKVKERISSFISKKKESQPVNMPSAGCVFKNPETASAGRLIDEAGCKGMRVGGIEVSFIHANFFVNAGGGTAEDYLNLMDRVKEKVARKFGIELHPEVRILKRHRV